jgi:hypothetical protein
MDLGGLVTWEFLDLFTQSGYWSKTNDSDVPLECSIRATSFLEVSLALVFWPYALYHFLRL